MLRNLQMPLPPAVRARTVTAVLGPTNTGKTHLAIERMLAHPTGMIGLPLRLLAREVYGRVTARAGEDAVALVTGEEKIVPKNPRFWVSTVEAMPLDIETDFLAIDEVQLAGDFHRGHVFTDRILNLRGAHETLLLGAATMRPILEKLLPGLNVVTRPRMSVLSYAGSRKITRVPPRSAVVAFSADEVYAIAELIRRQRGGAAVVLGSLSPRTRNAQVELFQSGDVDVLVATDAIGMGLNLDVDHVAFAADRKFDGYQHRNLTPAEIGQIAGRAGRHMRDGTFGVTSRVAPFDDELVEHLETHRFQPVKMLQWRNAALDFESLEALRNSLDKVPGEPGLTRAPPAVDQIALEFLTRDSDIRARADRRDRVSLLWDCCQVPDYRKIAPANHADLISTIFTFLVDEGRIPDDWFARQVAHADHMDGDIDTLANRIAHIRTWTFVANRPDWLGDPVHWQDVTRDVENRLSDALHERLTQRFVDRRTSVLMRRLRENAMLEAEITATGDVLVEGQHVGHLQGFRFAPDAGVEGNGSLDAKALRAAAGKALVSEIETRAERVSAAPNTDFALASDGVIRWKGEVVAKLVAGDDVLKPGLLLLADDLLSGPAREKVQARLDLWLKTHVETLLKPLFDLRDSTEVEGIARGVAFRMVEALGIVERPEIAEDVRQLDQPMRAVLRRLGVRFGAYHIYIPALLKPAPSQLIAKLWALKNGDLDMPGLAELPQLSASGRTSIPVDPTFAKQLYRAVGYRVCGERAVRVDILERLADLIRPLISWKKSVAEGQPPRPEGAIDEGGGFTVTVAMTSLLGCSGEDFNSILKSLGYRFERREIPNPALQPAEAETPTPPAVADETQAAPAPGDAEAEADVEISAHASAQDGPDETPQSEAPAIVNAAPQEVPADTAGELTAAPQPADEDATKAQDAAAAEPESADAADADASLLETDAAPQPVQSSDEPTASAAPATTTTDEPKGEEEIPATIAVEIWRPGRGDRRRHGGRPQQRARSSEDGQAPQGRPARRGGDGKRQGKGGGQGRSGEGAGSQGHGRPGQGGQGKGGGEGRGGRPPKSGGKPHGGRDDRKAPRRIDPDSPFAALAALKASMEKPKDGK
ncbi:ATP-dependent RNA helicase SUPV3L1/SUV3 [Breoghania corrubedonensis]|uniref:ATP-dependent RNA helicase SUPV3L1/SUV3 n=2 Tax=Breoghania corrubedonensis TaxID=665038 RepID=A0A2T5V5N0_9HYPH|nr:ATP-dependent RNA helicase SUPV3L1/SUV3 [Breoghania corrubedonensis]